MRKLFLIAIFLGLVASPNIITADERIISFDADNFTDISTDPTFRWSFNRETFRPIGDGIQLDEFTNSGPTFLSTSPSAIQETDDCVANSCIQISGGSPDMEIFTDDAFNTNYNTADDWSLTFYIKFTELPTVNHTIAGVWAGANSAKSWMLFYQPSESDINFLISTTGSDNNVVDGPAVVVDTWYLIGVTGSGSSNLVTLSIYNSSGLVGSTSTALVPFDGVTTPLLFMGNWATLRSDVGGLPPSNFEGDYNSIIDEILFWDSTTLNSAELLELSTLIPQPSVLLPDITNYQLTAAVEATNNTGSLITNRTIPFTINFEDLIDFGFLDSSLKDFYVLDDSFSNLDYMITAGNPASNASYVFAEVPSIANTQTYTINELVGLSTTNQGKLYKTQYPFIFTGDDLVEVADNALLDQVRDFSVSVPVSITSIPSSNAWLLDKLDAGLTTGYGILINTTGDIVIYIDAQTCTIPVASLTYPINDTISFSVSGEADGDPNLNVRAAIGSDIEVGCSLATGATINTENIRIGENIVGNVYEFVLTNDNVAVNRLEIRFDPTDYTQTQEGNSGNGYTWLGDLTTYGSVSTGGTYTIVSDLTNIDINQTGLIVNTAEEIPVVPTPNPNIIGTPPSIVTTPAPSVNLPFTPLIIDSADSIGITDQALWFILFYVVAVMFAFGTHILLNTEFLSIMVLSTIVLLGTLSDVYAAWLTAATLPLVIGVYALTQLRRVGEIA